MDEVVFYVGNDSAGNPAPGIAASLHSLNQYAAFRDAASPPNGAAITGFGSGARILTASPKKALIQVHAWGKEAVDQRMPVPEPLLCLQFCSHPTSDVQGSTPWLCAGGSASGKVYVWEYELGSLLAVIDAHYQGVSQIAFSLDSSYMVTAGLDSRTSVWRIADCVLFFQEDRRIKPFYSIADHSLAVTGICMVGALVDVRLYTALRDGTLCVYNIPERTHLSTIILPRPAECIAVDLANRQVYAGLDDGSIRIIPLYRARNSVLESVIGARNVVTVSQDPELAETFVHHQQSGAESSETTPSVTALTLSFDGTVLVSGDSLGRVMAADVASRQVTRTFTPCNAAISCIKVSVCPSSVLGVSTTPDRRTLTPFKRVLASTSPLDHFVTCTIPAQAHDEPLFEEWLIQRAEEEAEFKNYSDINSSVRTVPKSQALSNVLQQQLDTVAAAYTELREKHEALLEKYTQQQI